MEGDLALQDEFILDFLDDYFLQYESSSITHLSVMGNTDLKRFDPLFNEISSHYNCIQNLATNNFKINGYEFIGLDVMPDYPFRLKDRCRLDTPEDNIQEQFGKGFLSTANGWEDIEYWPGFVKTLPTIEEELEQLPTPEFMEKSIYVMHMPPAFLGLDVCQGNVKVGSRAIYNFFENKQPLLSLHGHIHESPQMSRIWKSKLKKTTCIQPGQDHDKLVYVTCNLDEMEFQRFIESTKK